MLQTLEEWLRYTRSLLAVVREEHAEAKMRLSQLEDRRVALEALLRIYDPGHNIDPTKDSIREILIQFAKDNDGILVSKDIVGPLLEKGVYDSRDDATRAMFTTLSRSKKDFSRVERGVWRYIGDTPTQPDLEDDPFAPLTPIFPPPPSLKPPPYPPSAKPPPYFIPPPPQTADDLPF